MEKGQALSELGVGPPDDRWRYRVAEECEPIIGGEGLTYRAIGAGGAEFALKMLTSESPAERPKLYDRAIQLVGLGSEMNVPAAIYVDVFYGAPPSKDPTVWDIEDFDILYVASPWISGWSLSALNLQDSSGVSTHDLLAMIPDFARTLAVLHGHRSESAPSGMIHRDIKPSNILVQPGRLWLVDFGLARPATHGDATGQAGTLGWRAPEIAAGNASGDISQDVWGLGAVVYWIVTGTRPGYGEPANLRSRLVADLRRSGFARENLVADATMRLLDSEPDRRPRSLGIWADNFERVLQASDSRPIFRRRVSRFLMGIAVLLVGSSVWGARLIWASPSSGEVAVHVSNRVTNGNIMIEDSAPAYLSTERRNFCSRLGCVVPDTEMSSGSTVVVACWAPGERTTNGNDGSPDDDNNPGLVATERWLYGRHQLGSSGWISEAWIDAVDRDNPLISRCSE